MSILHIAQKNSIAKEVANILSQSRKRNVPTKSKFNPIYEFDLEEKVHRFSSVRGHIFDHQLPDQCKAWRSFDNIKILMSQVPMIKILGKDMNDVVRNLQDLACRNNQLVLWLDCDREGEAIAFQVIEICTKINSRLKIKRARFSAVTAADIWRAYHSLVNPNQLEADAVNYRIQIDFRAGCSFTRYQTTTFQTCFEMQNGAVLSYGPCQIPTLSFVVQRYLQIKNFKPQKYWFIEMDCIINQTTGIPFTWEKKNTRNQVEANQALYNILNSFPDGKVTATVISRKNLEKKKYRPYPLTTVKFQKLATDKLKLSSAQAMSIAQKLYQNGFISYPRTETNSFPKTMNLKALVQRLQSSEQFGEYIHKLLDDNKFIPPKSGNQNDEAHTPIHPVKTANRSSLTPTQWRVYQLIVRSFLACCSADAIGQEYEVRAQIAGEKFKASYLTIKEMNFLEIYPYERWVETSFPANIPNKFSAFVDLKEGKTTPPGYMTESQLIDMMEKNQIGTDATIHEHIQTIQKRDYAIKSSNTFKPTNVGAALVQTYQQLQVSLPKCDIRRRIEQKMNMIAEGRITKNNATHETLHEMIPIYEKLMGMREQWIQTMKKYMESNSELKKVDLNEKGEGQQNLNRKQAIEACKCQKCGQKAYVRYVERNQSYFLGCSKYPSCKWTQSLPTYIQQIKQTQKNCTKCELGKVVRITTKQGKVVDSFMMKIRFDEADQEGVEVCLTPQCDRQFYENIQEYAFRSYNNTSSNIASNVQRSNANQSNHHSTNFNHNSNTNSRPNNYRSNSNFPNFNHQDEGSTNKYKNKSSTHNNNGSKHYSSNWGNKNKQIICFRCKEPGHIVPQCPEAGGGRDNATQIYNNFRAGFPKAKKQRKNNYHGDATEENQEEGQSKKVCKQCGAVGRHPRGSNCIAVVRKRKNKD